MALGRPHATDALVKSVGSSDEFDNGSKDCPLQFNKVTSESILIVPGDVPDGSASSMEKLKLTGFPGSVIKMVLLAGESAVEK